MKAIVIAAGRGSRLGRFTDDIPKCMVTVSGRPLLHHTVDRLCAAGSSDIVVIRGYAADQIQCPNVRFVDHQNWMNTNVLGSLFAASKEITGDVVIVYGDIVFRSAVIAASANSSEPIVPIVDVEWREAYTNRVQHPLAEAEKVKFGPDGLIEKIGKLNVSATEADAEFIGMLRLNGTGAAQLSSAFAEAEKRFNGRPFETAARFETAYLTDLLQFMIRNGEQMTPAKIRGGWREIDTPEDLERAEEWFVE